MRDDFTTDTKDVLAKRVGMRCSNPDCGQQTAGPRSNPQKAINIGVAAHITAASPNGPRFDSSLTIDERRSANNGIWLCQNCAKVIDNDETRFTITVLQQWKRVAEETARREVTQPKKATSHPAQVNAAVLIQGPNAINVSGANAVRLGSNAIKIVQNVRPADDELRQERSAALAQFVVEAQQLRARLGEDPLPIVDHNEWVDRTSEYLRNQLGPAYEVRFSDFSGMVFYGDGPDRSEMSKSLEGRTRRLHEFLNEIAVQ